MEYQKRQQGALSADVIGGIFHDVRCDRGTLSNYDMGNGVAMAPAVEPAVVIIFPWEVFTAYGTDGLPLIGGRLWTFAANTTTPKASFADPYFLTPNTQPVILNAMGQAIVWLDGFYHLRLEDADGVQLWDMPSYEFASGAPAPTAGLVSGMTEVTTVTPSAGAGTITVPNLVPLGYRVEGALVRIDTAFGASNGLTGIAIGDATAVDRWGTIGLTAGLQTTQQAFHGADRPIAATAYTIILSAVGGTFDVAGSCTVRGFWSSITGWS